MFLKSQGVSTSPVKVKKMMLHSSAFDESSFNEIKTKNINSIYPVIKNNEQYVYDHPSPILINPNCGSPTVVDKVIVLSAVVSTAVKV